MTYRSSVKFFDMASQPIGKSADPFVVSIYSVSSSSGRTRENPLLDNYIRNGYKSGMPETPPTDACRVSHPAGALWG